VSLFQTYLEAASGGNIKEQFKKRIYTAYEKGTKEDRSNILDALEDIVTSDDGYDGDDSSWFDLDFYAQVGEALSLANSSRVKQWLKDFDSIFLNKL